MAAVRRITNSAEEVVEAEMSARDPGELEQAEDNDLWGCPPPPPPPVPGNPQTPPNAVLMRGGHVVFIALDGNKANAPGYIPIGAEVETVAFRAGRKMGL